jgi:O-methyltransferase
MGTSHTADFLRDRKFIHAYLQGVATRSWDGNDLRWRVYNACWAAERALGLEGDFVECGVNRGGISRTVIEYVNFGTLQKKFFLLDTFRGSPNVADVNQDDYKECYDDVVKTFAHFSNVRIVRGFIPETLHCVTSDKICYLSIDMNDAEPEVSALEYFWDKLVPGSAVILDDYAYSEHYREQKNAMDGLGIKLGFSVLTMPTGQGLIIK